MTTLETLLERTRTRRSLPDPATRRAIRKAARVSMHELAKALGVSHETISGWERGSYEPQGDNLTRYLHALRELEKAASEPLA